MGRRNPKKKPEQSSRLLSHEPILPNSWNEIIHVTRAGKKYIGRLPMRVSFDKQELIPGVVHPDVVTRAVEFQRFVESERRVLIALSNEDMMKRIMRS